MSEIFNVETGSTTNWPPTFRGGIWPAIVFVLAFSLWVLFTNTLLAQLFGPDPAFVPEQLLSIISKTIQIGATVLILRYEGVRLRDIGLSTQLIVPAIIAIGGLLIVLNAVVAGLVVLDGNELSVGVFALLQSPPQNYPLSAILLGSINFYLFVGPAEELAFRGYLQNKLTALLGGGNDRIQIAVGVVAAAVIFALLHIPTILLVGGFQLQALAGTLLLNALSGIAFGTIYALTRNLYLVAFLHGIGDWWPLFIDPGSGAWPNWGVLIVLYALLVLLYRQWATRTARSNLGVAG
jgi:membrane protease YdiL (CAAX protease family)